jgi:hypothetical protein
MSNCHPFLDANSWYQYVIENAFWRSDHRNTILSWRSSAHNGDLKAKYIISLRDVAQRM